MRGLGEPLPTGGSSRFAISNLPEATIPGRSGFVLLLIFRLSGKYRPCGHDHWSGSLRCSNLRLYRMLHLAVRSQPARGRTACNTSLRARGVHLRNQCRRRSRYRCHHRRFPPVAGRSRTRTCRPILRLRKYCCRRETELELNRGQAGSRHLPASSTRHHRCNAVTLEVNRDVIGRNDDTVALATKEISVKRNVLRYRETAGNRHSRVKAQPCRQR